MNPIKRLEERATNIEERAQARIREASDPANHYPRGKRLTAGAVASQIQMAERSLSLAYGLREAANLLRSGVDVYLVKVARVGYNHLGSTIEGAHFFPDVAELDRKMYPEDTWEAVVEVQEVKE